MKLSRRFSGSESGVAAVEMALVAPIILLLGFIPMWDVGAAVAARMDLDRAVRAGVQAVMANINDVDDVKDVVVASLNGAPGVSVAVNKRCECGSTSAACTSLCSAQEPPEPPSVFVDISAAQTYSGRLLQLDLKSETYVQLR
jgi:Flp pilus assembly pilin Flp